jgi:hypothetical protein
MAKPFTIVWALLCIASISLTAKANQSAPFIQHQGANSLSCIGIVFPGDISDKLAADSRFIELMKIEVAFQTKFRSLSSADKKLLQTCLKEKNTSTMLVLFRKCGIDFKNYISSKTSVLKALDKDYEIEKRNDKEQIFRAAISKLADPPTFAECLALFSSGSTLCTELCWGNDDCMLACWSTVMAHIFIVFQNYLNVCKVSGLCHR